MISKLKHKILKLKKTLELSNISSTIFEYLYCSKKAPKKITWVGWNNICLQKDYGGLG